MTIRESLQWVTFFRSDVTEPWLRRLRRDDSGIAAETKTPHGGYEPRKWVEVRHECDFWAGCS